MTINELLSLAGLTANDEIPVWDAEAADEPTKKIKAQNLAASVKALADLVGEAELTEQLADKADKAVVDALDEEVDDLKSAIDSVIDVYQPEKIAQTGLFDNQEIQYWRQTAQRIIYIECNGSTKYTISKTLGDSFKIGCTASAPAVGVAILGYYAHSSDSGTVEYTTPKTAQYLLVHCSVSAPVTADQLLADVVISTITGAKDNVARAAISNVSEDVFTLTEGVNDLTDSVSSIEENFDAEEYTDESYVNTTITPNVGFMATNGNVTADSDFIYTQKIPVSEGQVISATNNANMRFICAFSGNTAVSAKGSSADTKSYTVPSGIDGIVVSLRVSSNAYYIRVTTISQKTAHHLKTTPMGYMMEQGNLAPSEKMMLPYHNVKNKNVYIFNANITTFNAVVFGKDATVTVNGTNIIVVNDNGTEAPIPHGLTITHDLTVMISNDESTSLTFIRVASNGSMFDYTTPVRFVMDEKTPTITSDGSTFTECTFAWISKNINTPIWLFGDSYFSWYSDRWTYYLRADGYTKCCLLNGYAGEKSNTAYEALLSLLAIRTPEKVVWCLGMNDGDTNGAVNADWYTIYQKVIELSKKYGFELVLYTVPTTPNMDNNYKNAIIRESGYRYIEADKAVRIDNDGHWVGYGTDNPALSADNVHPSATGAKILYGRILADLPEIMSDR